MVLIGRSLGGGVATALAHQHGARGLVLQNTFASLHETAAGRYPWLPVEWLIRNRYPSIEWIAGYRGPLLQSHGKSDRLIPYSEGRRLFAACPSERKEFFTIKGGDHNDREPSEYDAALKRWYEALPKSAGASNAPTPE